MAVNIVCCPFSGGDDNPPQFCVTTVKMAARNHCCCECNEVIPKGTRYEHVAGKWDGEMATYRTCLSCVEIRDHFTCADGYLFTYMWSQLEENFFPT